MLVTSRLMGKSEVSVTSSKFMLPQMSEETPRQMLPIDVLNEMKNKQQC